MLAKRTTASLAVLTATLIASAPALAERGGHRDHRDVQHHYHVKHRPVVHHYHVKHRPVVHHYHVRHRPVVHHYHYRPAPVVYHQQVHPHNGVAILAGAVLGAAILHHVVTGY